MVVEGGGGRKKLHANRLEEKILHEKYAQEKILTDVRKKIPAIQSWEKSFKQKILILPPLTFLMVRSEESLDLSDLQSVSVLLRSAATSRVEHAAMTGLNYEGNVAKQEYQQEDSMADYESDEASIEEN